MWLLWQNEKLEMIYRKSERWYAYLDLDFICKRSWLIQGDPHLVMYQDLHNIIVDFRCHMTMGLIWPQHKLDPQERHQYQCGPYSLHVQASLRLMGHLQLGDQNTDDI